jgi:glycerol-3-phosphate acyltransferase PlsY
VSSFVWIIFAFLCGSLPFSVWVGKYYLKTDIRTVGDANPGATNVYRAGGRAVAALALFLDFIKGALPVGLAYLWAGLTNPHLIWVSLAPVAGHAFSPFLGGRGGKAVAVTFGIWAGLTGWEGPTVAGVFLLAGVALFGANGWAVLMTTVGLAAYMLLTPASWNTVIPRPEPVTLLAVSIGTTAILGWKHRADFAHPPSLSRGSVPWR